MVGWMHGKRKRTPSVLIRAISMQKFPSRGGGGVKRDVHTYIHYVEKASNASVTLFGAYQMFPNARFACICMQGFVGSVTFGRT